MRYDDENSVIFFSLPLLNVATDVYDGSLMFHIEIVIMQQHQSLSGTSKDSLEISFQTVKFSYAVWSGQLHTEVGHKVETYSNNMDSYL